MYELTIREADNLILAQEHRANKLTTKEGQAEAVVEMLKLIKVLTYTGYRMPSEEYEEIAIIWASQLSEVIINYGYEVLRKALYDFIKNDTRRYKQIPTTGEIIEICKKNGVNPKVYKAKLNQIERETELHKSLGFSEEDARAKANGTYESKPSKMPDALREKLNRFNKQGEVK